MATCEYCGFDVSSDEGKTGQFWIGYVGSACVGIEGDLGAALADTGHPFEALNHSDFDPVSKREYDNTLLDVRFEHSRWIY
jgi:hypothetical protein